MKHHLKHRKSESQTGTHRCVPHTSAPSFPKNASLASPPLPDHVWWGKIDLRNSFNSSWRYLLHLLVPGSPTSRSLFICRRLSCHKKQCPCPPHIVLCISSCSDKIIMVTSTYSLLYFVVSSGDWFGKVVYRARLKGLGQVLWMLQASSGKNDEQQQQQNSPNSVTTF